MPETAEEVYARVVAAVGTDGRLPVPDTTTWDTFPWEVVDGALAPKVVSAPAPEGPRWGDEGSSNKYCPCTDEFDASRVVWEDERWVLTHEVAPSGLPIVLMLQPKEHLDYGELDDDLASELGRISTRLVRIIEHLPHIARVHVNRWGDGNAHCHVWFFARTEQLGVRGRLGRHPPGRSRGDLARGPAHRRRQAGQLGRRRPVLRRTPSAQKGGGPRISIAPVASAAARMRSKSTGVGCASLACR
jgi:diadenosine tetraphosphate (Ap4A) HIT family hydrolase